MNVRILLNPATLSSLCVDGMNVAFINHDGKEVSNRKSLTSAIFSLLLFIVSGNGGRLPQKALLERLRSLNVSPCHFCIDNTRTLSEVFQSSPLVLVNVIGNGLAFLKMLQTARFWTVKAMRVPKISLSRHFLLLLSSLLLLLFLSFVSKT